MTGAKMSMPFTRILCWVDGSDEACRAAERAAKLARTLGAELSFLAIGTDSPPDPGFEAYARIERVSDPMPPRVPRTADACLDQALAIAIRSGVEKVERIVGSGDAVMVICETARMKGADLVVLGRHRSTFVERIFGTSVPDALTKGCGFAVLSDG